jgi:hypothetical protein
MYQTTKGKYIYIDVYRYGTSLRVRKRMAKRREERTDDIRTE